MTDKKLPMRQVYIVSDGTGLTAEALARSVLSQFEIPFQKIRYPFIDTPEKIQEVTEHLRQNRSHDAPRPIVFSTLVKPELLSILHQADALHIDVIQPLISKLAKELGTQAKQEIGLSHQQAASGEYEDRIDAIQFSIAHDDGQSHANLEAADIILLGVSRSGKTPTSLYLAIQYGLKAANYPLIPEDFERGRLPSVLQPFKRKLFGLSINPVRLSQIRSVRLPNSKYASIDNCRYEIQEAETIMEKEGISWLSSTNKSVEEIAATIVHQTGIGKRV
ncbi:MAG: kinase/pyrophosphorylase [Burkholderiaceae bacterium]|jgi:regulator of PEP synthase PpsR (kinase-PPPase family)|nr:kinase/pyrophosphorylase [Burkholderiaceae bacterium]